MKGGRQPHGFTIVETMIFIAVSGVLFLGALQLINNKQNQTEFTSRINIIRSELQSTMSNVATGYYHTQTNLQCSENPGGPNFSLGAVGTNSLGQNTGCIFMGSVIQFGTSSGGDEVYNNIPVGGLQFVYANSAFTSNLTSTLYQARPKIINVANATTATTLGFGIHLHTPNGVCYQNAPNPSPCTPIASNAFGLLAFNGCTGLTAGTQDLSSGTQCIYVIPLPSPLFNSASNSIDISDTTSCTGDPTGSVCNYGSASPYVPENPSNGIQVCLDSGTTKESAKFIIGGLNNATGVSMQRYSQPGCV